MKKGMTSLFICSLVLSSLSLGTLVQAQEYDQQIENQTNTINALSQQQQDKTTEIEAIEATIATNQTTVTQLTAEKEQLTSDIKKKYETISTLTVRIQKREEQLKAQARNTQTSERSSYLSVLLNAESFSDAVSRIQGMTTMVQANHALVKQQAQDKKVLEQQTTQVNEQLKTIEKNQKEMANKEKELNVLQLNAEIEKNDLQAQKTIEENKKATFIAQKEEAQKKLAEEQRAQEQALKEQQIKEIEKEQQVQEQKHQEQEVQKAAIQTPKIESAQKEVAEETPIPVTKEDQVDHTVTTPEENGTVPTNTETVSIGKQAAAQAALSEVGTARATGWNAPGECLVSVRRWLGAGGITFGYGDVHSGYVNSGAREISWGDIQVGDVIQYENVYTPDGWIGGIHTMLVVALTNGQATIVESNNPEGSGYVSKRENWSPTPPAGFRAAIWHFPG